MSKNIDIENGATYGIAGNYTNNGQLGINDNWFGTEIASYMSIGGILVNYGNINIDTSNSNGFGASGGSSLTIGGMFINVGTVNIGNENLGDGMAGNPETTVTASTFVNKGGLNISGSGSNQAELLVGSAAPNLLLTSIDLYGDALLQYGAGAITQIGASGSLILEGAIGPNLAGIGGHTGGGSGPTALPQIAVSGMAGETSALDKLTFNSGQFDLDYGVSFSTAAGVSFVNEGLIGLDYNEFGPVFDASMSIGGNLINSGEIYLDTANSNGYGAAGGGSLTVGGTLTNIGSLNIGNENLDDGVVGNPDTTVTASAFVNRGTLNISGSGSNRAEFLAGSAVPTVLQSSIDLYGDALLQYASGAMTEIGESGSLILEGAIGPNLAGIGGHTGGGSGTQALPQITISGLAGETSALDHLAINAGQLELDYGVSLNTAAGVNFVNEGKIGIDYNEFGPVFGASMSIGGNLINRGNIYLDNANSNGYGAAGGGSLTVRGTLINTGSLNIGNENLDDGVSGDPETMVKAGAFVNEGALNISGSGSNQAELLANSAAPGLLSTSIDLYGDALLQYASGAITEIGATGSLLLEGAIGPALGNIGGHTGGGNGPQALPQITISGVAGETSALDKLTLNKGQLELDYGVSFSTAAGVSFVNEGLIGIDYNEFGAVYDASMSIGGNLINSGDIYLDTSNSNGFGGAGGGSLTVVGTLTNTGTLAIGGSNLGYGVPTPSGSMVSVGGLRNNATGQISLQGSSSGTATFTVAGESSNAGSITVSGFATLTTGVLSNFGTIAVEGGGATIGGALTGLGTLSIEGGELTIASTVISTQVIDFVAGGGDGELVLGQPTEFHGTITGLTIGDSIELVGVEAATGVTVRGNDLVVALNGGGTLPLATSGSLSNLAFYVTKDTSGLNSVITAVNLNTTPLTFIYASAPGQTLTGAANFGDEFQGISANFNTDTISGFGGNDVMDLTDMGFLSAALTYSGNDTTGTLTIADGTHSAAITLTGGTNYASAVFGLASDGHGGTSVLFL